MAQREPPDGAARFVPARPTLAALRNAAAGCTGCPLFERGTQTVFGAGPSAALIMLVGEQPGDVEDRAGAPFVGPAGRLLDQALEAAGIARERAYLTNAVKHFKWTPRGKCRIHAKPNLSEMRACRPWQEAEIAVVRPRVIVALGATAAQTLLGPDFRVTRRRGEFLEQGWAERMLATIHPSALLRIPSREGREEEMGRFVADLARAGAAAS